MIINEEHYNELMFIFSDYRDNKTVLTLFWEDGSILKGVSDIGYGETDSDIPEESDKYPGYYSAFLKIDDIISLNKKDLDFDTSYGYLEIDMLNAPMLVKVDDEIVWEKAEDK